MAGKNDLVVKLAEHTGLTQTDVRTVVDALPEVMRDIVIADESRTLTIPGFSKLELIWSDERTGRNPSNGEAIQIPARYSLKLSSAKSYKDSVTVSEDEDGEKG